MRQALIICLLLLSSASRAETPAAPTWLNEGEKVKWLGENYGPEWIEKNSKKMAATPVTKEPSPGAQLSPQWLPICFFFDPTVNPAIANQKIRAVAQAYGACGIAMEPYSFTLRSDYPANAKALKVAAEKACPFPTAFGIRGAIQVETRFPEVPKQMCDDPEAEGCSTLCSSISVSFVKPNAGAAIGLHESMHSNCCGPLCVDKGEGSGFEVGGEIELAFLTGEKTVRAAKKVTLPPAILEEGCAALRAGASPNNFTHWYEPEKTEYYIPEKDPSKQKDLLEGKNILPKIEVAIAPVTPQRAPASFLVPKELVLPNAAEAAPSPAMAPAEIKKAFRDAEDTEDGVARKRGAGLRRSGDANRKGSGSGIGTVDAYSSSPE